MSGESYERREERLDNGLPLVMVRMPHLHSAVVSVFARVGSRHEDHATNGLSHFLEHMLFRGCEGYPDSPSLSAAMEDLGGVLDGCTMRDLSAFQICVHPDCTADAIGILGRMFRTPSLREIDLERAIILEEMLDGIDHRGRVIDLDVISHRESFTTHPLGQPIDGSRRNVRSFNRDDLERHRKRYYGADNLLLCVVGRFASSKVRREAEAAFGPLFSGKRSRESAPKLPERAPRFRYVHSEDARTRARLSYRTVTDTHDDYPALVLLRKILDDGLSSRLQVEMVEQRGLVYEVSADTESYSDCGLFDFEFAVAHKKLDLALVALSEIIRDLRERPESVEKIERVRRRTRMSIDFGMDSAYELSNWYGATALFHEPLTPSQRMAQLDRVTPEDLRRVARRYFRPDRMSIAAVGGADPATVRSARKTVRKHFVEAF